MDRVKIHNNCEYDNNIPLISPKSIKRISLNKDHPDEDPFNSESFFKQKVLDQFPIGFRKFNLNGQTQPQNKQSNHLNNAKYNIFTFLPLVLYQQFNYFFNLYFLALTITQLVPILKVGFLINYIGPLSLVVTLSLCKEAWDDIQRHQRDSILNKQWFGVLSQDGLKQVQCQNMKPGMIVQLSANQRVPADLIVLSSRDPEGIVFLRTDQLDGETDWKLRKAVQMTHLKYYQNPNELLLADIDCICEGPSPHIYEFNGAAIGGIHTEKLSLENTLWAGTVLATSAIWGLVIYTGKETRVGQNSQTPQTKFGVFDREVNNLAKMLFLLMLIVTVMVTILSQPTLDAKYLITLFVRYLILLSNIIPISMRVNLEFAKLVYSIRINRDQCIEGTITRNSNIPESLGRVDYLLSDKTGTLTKNEMRFRSLSLQHMQFTDENKDYLTKLLREEYQKDIPQNKNHLLFDLMRCLVLCNNVTPTADSGESHYQASSPDEIALVEFAESVNFKLIERTQKQIKIERPDGNLEIYEILNCFPFSSDTKRMGIIVRMGGQITFFTKGADTVIKPLVQEVLRGFIDEESENLSLQGLRTLTCAFRKLSSTEYIDWVQLYEKAQLEFQQASVVGAMMQLEQGMLLLGITGVEDRLQEDVSHSVDNIRGAGIKVWMLTGDKMETAVCAAIASGIKSPIQQIFYIKEVNDEVSIRLMLVDLQTKSTSHVLVIDGESLQTALAYHEGLFITTTAEFASVCVCRCSPTQKAKMAQLLKQYTGKVIACVGDGGNDVAMIQQADVGIGIEGKEGKQAALASDYSVTKFRNLVILILWHGRLSYKRSALLSQFVIHRGLLITVVQALFMFYFYFLSIGVFSGYLMLGYSTLFTMLPVFCIIFDQDVDMNIALKYPALYATLQQGRELNSKTFLVWLFKALYQGFIIMSVSLFFIDQPFLKIQSIAFTCMIFTQYAMLLTELASLHLVMIISNILSVIVYLLTMFIFRAQFGFTSMSLQFIGNVLLIMLISWLPLFLGQLIKKYFDPSDFQKIMKHVKREKINLKI